MSEKTFLRATAVCKRYGDINPSTLWRWVKFGRFPKPRQEHGVKLWDPDVLDAYDEAKAAAHADAA